MINIINKSHHEAIDKFAEACQDCIGIKPSEDDRLIFKSAIDFGTYIKTFKRLDLTTEWHRRFVNTMVKAKVDALSKRINQEYGTHKEYISRMKRRCGTSRETDQGDSTARETETC